MKLLFILVAFVLAALQVQAEQPQIEQQSQSIQQDFQMQIQDEQQPAVQQFQQIAGQQEQSQFAQDGTYFVLQQPVDGLQDVGWQQPQSQVEQLFQGLYLQPHLINDYQQGCAVPIPLQKQQQEQLQNRLFNQVFYEPQNEQFGISQFPTEYAQIFQIRTGSSYDTYQGDVQPIYHKHEAFDLA